MRTLTNEEDTSMRDRSHDLGRLAKKFSEQEKDLAVLENEVSGRQ